MMAVCGGLVEHKVALENCIKIYLLSLTHSNSHSSIQSLYYFDLQTTNRLAFRAELDDVSIKLINLNLIPSAHCARILVVPAHIWNCLPI